MWDPDIVCGLMQSVNWQKEAHVDGGGNSNVPKQTKRCISTDLMYCEHRKTYRSLLKQKNRKYTEEKVNSVA